VSAVQFCPSAPRKSRVYVEKRKPFFCAKSKKRRFGTVLVQFFENAIGTGHKEGLEGLRFHSCVRKIYSRLYIYWENREIGNNIRLPLVFTCFFLFPFFESEESESGKRECPSPSLVVKPIPARQVKALFRTI
jgi:hypothetical protein